jgi:tRNA threonylcarbamoyladenosine biosynthesis protein TsaB
MRILAFDTCFGACSAAILETSESGAGSCLTSLYEEMDAGHAERLMPMISEVLDRAGLSLRGVDCIGVTVGPGTFTGVRTGIAAARGLALARGLTVVGTTSLAVMGASAVAQLGGSASEVLPMAVCVDARRGQLYVENYPGRPDARLDEALVATAEEAVLALPDVRLAVGSGAAAFQHAARAIGREVRIDLPRLQPDAAYMTRLPLPKLDPPRPLYLRAPDAKPQAGKSSPRARA